MNLLSSDPAKGPISFSQVIKQLQLTRLDYHEAIDWLAEHLPSQGWMSHQEIELIVRRTFHLTGPVLEVGSYCGRSLILHAITGRQVYSVDPFTGFDSGDPSGHQILATLLKNLQKWEISHRMDSESDRGEQVVLYRYRVEEMPTAIPIEFAYLDGDHTFEGTQEQILYAQKCGAKLIAVHDVNDHGEGTEIKRACLETIGREWDERAHRLAFWKL